METFEPLIALYKEWNSKVNLISRSDIENLYERHIQHSLAIAKFIQFKPGTQVMDLGTGGGFPGIPLALAFPDVQFTLVDSIGKKIKVVQAIATELKLPNVQAINIRAELVDEKFDFVVTRAVAPLSQLELWSRGKFKKKGINAYPNGIIALKGGDLSEELKPYKKRVWVEPLSTWYDSEFFKTKSIVYLPM